MAIENTTFRLLVEKLGGSDPSVFVGNEGEVFYDPDASSPTLRLSDGSTAGGIAIGGSGGMEIVVEEENSPITTADIEINAVDTYGDGWNGGLVNVYVDDVLIVENFTVPDVGDNTETATTILPNVSAGSVIKIERVALGDYPEEMEISSVSIRGIAISSETHNFDADGEIFLFTVPSSYFKTPTSYGQDGDARFNHYLNYVEYYDGNSWKPGVTGDIVVKNSTNIVSKFLTTGGDAGINNVLLGTSAGSSITTGNIFGSFGSDNVLIGFEAGLNNIGSSNNFIGKQAGYNTTSGSSNNFFGYGAGYNNTTGNVNTFICVLAGGLNTTGTHNHFIGYSAGGDTTTGSNNIAIGQNAGNKHTTGSHNTFLGSYTGLTSTASRKVIIGSGYNLSNLFDAPDPTKNTQLAIGVKNSTAASKYWLVGNENFNVGIGVNNPTTKLEVGGIIGFRDTNVRLGDSTTGANLTTNIANYEGVFNNFIGVNAGNSLTNGFYNNFFGYHAGAQNNGYYNNFFGRYAGANSPSGGSNLFLGDQAGRYSGDIYNNIFIGNYAGYESDNGNLNIFIGQNAGYSNKNQSNTFIGNYAGEDNTTGQVNNFFGTGSGGKNTTGSYNLFLGYVAGGYNITGSNNVFFGNRAGKGNISGSNNIFFGHYSGISTAASRKVIIGSGFGSGYEFDAPDTTKNTQLAIGVRTSTAASNYWLVGNENFNVGVGVTDPQVRLQLDGTLGFKTYFRDNATRTNILIGDATTGAAVANSINANDNIYMGIGAGSSATGGYNNFFGRDAGGNGGGGAFNNFIGYYAGYQNDYGASNNVFIGSGTGGYGPNQGSRNNFIGFYAGSANTTGSYNNFFGSGGLSNTTGNYNTFFGAYSGSNNTTGSYNNSFGQRAGKNNTTGSHNIYVGGFSGISTTASRKVIIGSGVNYSTLFDAPDTTKDTQLAIGIRTSSAPANYWIVGNENFNVGVGVTNPTSKLTVGGDIKAGTTASQGIILTDANGVAWRLTINTNGTLTTSTV